MGTRQNRLSDIAVAIQMDTHSSGVFILTRKRIFCIYPSYVLYWAEAKQAKFLYQLFFVDLAMVVGKDFHDMDNNWVNMFHWHTWNMRFYL